MVNDSFVIPVELNTSPDIDVTLVYYTMVIGFDYLYDANSDHLLDAAGDLIYG